MKPIRARVIVSGRVQGVFFRDTTMRRATELGLGGWVRNLSNGCVEAVFEGKASAVRRGVDFVRRGPPAARVDDVQLEEEEIDRPCEGFRIT